MKLIVFTSLLIALAVFISGWRSPGIATDSYTGYAYDKGTTDLVYTEEFTDRFIDGKHIETLTAYFDPNHRKIAHRVLDFRKSRFAPDFKTEDLRSGYLEGAEISGDQVRLFRRKDKDSKEETKTLNIPQPVVIDGGFNQFIKSNWEKLEKGETITFQFAVPARLDYFTLRATKASSRDNEMAIEVQPEKTLLRWLSSPIVVRYSKDTRRIKTYEGQSNISNDRGDNFVMKLVYPKKGP
jgi:hypothetical protein